MAGHVLFIHPLDSEIMEIKVSLEEKGIHVAVQPNPLQALNYARVNLPDVVVTEILTRPVGGFEIASAISIGKYGFTAPVIFYTEFYRDERTRRDVTAKYGALHYFVKPFHREALKKAILYLLEESSRFRGEIPRPNQTEISLELSSSKLLPKDEAETMSSTLASATAQPESLFAASSPAESLPESKQVTVLEPANRKVDVEPAFGGDTSCIPAKTQVPNLPTIPAAGSGIDEKIKIQEFASHEEYNSQVIKADRTEFSPKPKPPALPVGFPLRYVKELNRAWLILVSVILLAFVAFLISWYRIGRSAPTVATEPDFESLLSSLPESGSPSKANSFSNPLEGNPDQKSKLRESVTEFPGKTLPEIPPVREAPRDPPSVSVESTPAQSTTIRSKSEVVIADISVSVREPQLKSMKKPVLSNDALSKMGRVTFVVRVVMDGKGNVTEVTPLNAFTRGASLPHEVLDAIWQWKFKAVDGREEDTFLKHYSFRAGGL